MYPKDKRYLTILAFRYLTDDMDTSEFKEECVLCGFDEGDFDEWLEAEHRDETHAFQAFLTKLDCN